MSTTFGRQATAAVRIRSGNGLMGTMNKAWTAYLRRRIERAAMMQLNAMTDRELQDIGLVRSQIEWAVRGDFDPGR